MYQHTVIVGRLGTDPEMRYTGDGTPVVNFSVAVNKRWTDGDGEVQERTAWFRVTAWRRLAEICAQYLSKGRKVLVEGDVSASAWTGRDGEPHATLELTARNVQFLDNGSSDDSAGKSGFNSGSEDEDDLPF